MITENGIANNDFVMSDGKVHNPQRIDFTRGYLRSLKRAVEEGIPVLGYQHWSVMDNFEWTEGYDPRFGLIYVDYATGKRIIKDSAWEYQKIIETNGATLWVRHEQVIICDAINKEKGCEDNNPCSP